MGGALGPLAAEVHPLADAVGMLGALRLKAALIRNDAAGKADPAPPAAALAGLGDLRRQMIAALAEEMSPAAPEG